MKTLILITALIMMTGCTSVQTFQPQPGSAQNQIVEGDRIYVLDKYGQASEIIVQEISEQKLVGNATYSPYQEITFYWNEISKIEKENVNSITRLGMFGATAIIIPVALVTGSVGLEWQ